MDNFGYDGFAGLPWEYRTTDKNKEDKMTLSKLHEQCTEAYYDKTNNLYDLPKPVNRTTALEEVINNRVGYLVGRHKDLGLFILKYDNLKNVYVYTSIKSLKDLVNYADKTFDTFGVAIADDIVDDINKFWFIGLRSIVLKSNINLGYKDNAVVNKRDEVMSDLSIRLSMLEHHYKSTNENKEAIMVIDPTTGLGKVESREASLKRLSKEITRIKELITKGRSVDEIKAETNEFIEDELKNHPINKFAGTKVSYNEEDGTFTIEVKKDVS